MMTIHRNDDELEMNWTAMAVDVSDKETAFSANSEDDFEEEVELELASGVKRSRETDVKMDTEDDNFVKKEKIVKGPVSNGKGLHRMKVSEHFKIVNDMYMKHRGGLMTSLELADGLNESHFLVPAGLGKHKLELLPSPVFLILCSSALRCVELIKHLTSFKCRVAKLFGKHLKADKQAKQLTDNYFPIAVGTPARVKKLMEMGALSMKFTKRLIFDMEKDKKQLTLLDLKDTATEMMDLLQFQFLPQLNKEDSDMKIVLF
ncbi:unnamed protein product [Peronospora farinosa]|uniref:Uncharacterized protein n=1 Tax=Peronospora farinosa TaxID=134698 RepID=A0ABN8CJI7_9STRA|nr:unnamed protein product [Peronospora farinosa]